ncbi:MAG: hypothetical protein J0M30_07625 [Chitinophagales bacterium]|nr:hypothetical protein [Chitinophagales bacterium]
MNIDKMEHFMTSIAYNAKTDAAAAFELFKSEYPKFSRDERGVLKGILEGLLLNALQYEVTPREHLYWSAMVTYSSKPIADGEFLPDIDDDVFPRMKISEGFNGNQITKVFRLLRDNGVINASWDIIAEAIATIFDIEERTAYKDLTEEKRLMKVQLPI